MTDSGRVFNIIIVIASLLFPQESGRTMCKKRGNMHHLLSGLILRIAYTVSTVERSYARE